MSLRLIVTRVRINQQGYAPGWNGQYFGTGYLPLYRVESSPEDDEQMAELVKESDCYSRIDVRQRIYRGTYFVRAPNANEARRLAVAEAALLGKGITSRKKSGPRATKSAYEKARQALAYFVKKRHEWYGSGDFGFDSPGRQAAIEAALVAADAAEEAGKTTNAKKLRGYASSGGNNFVGSLRDKIPPRRTTQIQKLHQRMRHR